MDFLGTILWPLKWVIELILVAWHWLFTAVGMPAAGGLTWMLSILGVVVVVRAALIPLFVKQIKSQRAMMELAPEIKKIQDRYRGKRDQLSREAMSRETMDLYKKHGSSPLSGCLPILVQMPVFFGLFAVLNDAVHGKASVGLLTAQLQESFANANFLGAPFGKSFADAFGGNAPWQNMVIAGTLAVLMVGSQFYTQLQITSKNVSDETKNTPMYRQQRILLYIIPLGFIFSAVAFPLGLNFYWFTSNIWTMVQQWMIIRRMPTPGSQAYRERQERLARRGRLEPEVRKEPGGGTTIVVEEPPKPAQRQQPMSKKRAKNQGAKPGPRPNPGSSGQTSKGTP